jgi:hypothetical protein
VPQNLRARAGEGGLPIARLPRPPALELVGDATNALEGLITIARHDLPPEPEPDPSAAVH